MTARRILISVCLIALCTCTVQAAWVIIPRDFETIQGAIDQSEDGDTLLVLPGVYQENIDFDGKNLILLAPGGPLATTIDGGGNGPCMSFTNEEGLSSIVAGFTLTNGSGGEGAGGGIRIQQATPVFLLNRIMGNTTGGNGGGVSVSGIGIIPPTFYRCEFSGNSCGGNGGGLYVSGMSTMLINCTLVSNTANGSGGAVYIDRLTAGVQLQNSIVVVNTSGRDGAVVRNPFLSQATATYNDVWNNQGGNYSNVQAGDGSISEDPVFIDPENGNYFIAENSPCVDAGSPEMSDFDGTRADMGAWPLIQGPDLLPIELEPNGLNFGEVVVNTDSLRAVTLFNPNEVPLQAAAFFVRQDSPFSVPETALVNIDGQSRVEVAIQFHPMELEQRQDTLRVYALAEYEVVFDLLDTTFVMPWPIGTTDAVVSGAGVEGNAVGQDNSDLPSNLNLLDTYPNPFNSSVQIKANIPIPGQVELSIWYMDGRKAVSLTNGALPAGEHVFRWDAQDFSAGTYIVRLVRGTHTEESRITLIK